MSLASRGEEALPEKHAGPPINKLKAASPGTPPKDDGSSEDNADIAGENEYEEDLHGNECVESYEDTAGEGAEWNPDEWYWDAKYRTWVFTGSKRIRKKDLSNKMEKNWTLGMRRNSDSVKKDKVVEKITIKRDNVSTVRIFIF